MKTTLHITMPLKHRLEADYTDDLLVVELYRAENVVIKIEEDQKDSPLKDFCFEITQQDAIRLANTIKAMYDI